MTSLNRLALGTVQFGLNYGVANQHGQVSLEEARAIIHYSRVNGMDTLDTANGYGDSEKRLGEIGVDDWHIVSKLSAIPEDCSDIAGWVTAAITSTLQRLNINSLHGLLLHRPQQLLEKCGEQLYCALQKLKNDGLVKKIGVSIYDPAELDTLSDLYRFDIVQAPFNILDRRLIESDWLSRLSSEGTELHVRSIFLQGLLLMEPGMRPQKFNHWQPTWDLWDHWINESGLTRLQACLRYVLMFPQIDRVVVGVDTLDQLTQIIHSMDGFIPPVPAELNSSNTELVNPAKWGELK